MDARKFTLAVVGAALVIATSATAEPVKTEAVIVSAKDGMITAKTRTGPLTVVVTPSTKISETSGLMNKKARDMQSLIPGLIFTVSGDQQGQTVTASDIRFKDRDWRAAIAAKAGTTEQFAELRSAIIGGQEYAIRDEATVYFATGSSVVSASDKQHLLALAQKAGSFGNYRISILGFADPRGDAAANERLSHKRATAVGNYLRQTGLIQPGRVLAESPMGEGTTAPGEAAPAGNEQARRVVVRVITPKVQLSQ
jgi:OmpA-OmpF porin, OOP family